MGRHVDVLSEVRDLGKAIAETILYDFETVEFDSLESWSAVNDFFNIGTRNAVIHGYSICEAKIAFFEGYRSRVKYYNF